MNALLSKIRPSPNARLLSTATLTLSLLLAACGPSDLGAAKLKKIPDAAKRNVVLAAMGTGPLAPSKPSDTPRIVSGFRHNIYLTGGEAYEVIWYRDDPGSLADPIVPERETPVVIQGDTLVGWGWKFYTPFAAKLNLPDPTHDRARADSIMRLQNPDSTRK